MRKIKDLSNFELNESLISKFITVDPKDLEVIKNAKVSDIGSTDTPVRKSIINTAFSLYSHFDKNKDRSEFVQKLLGMDDDNKLKVLNSAKAYGHTLEKIQKIENDEIGPNYEGLNSIMDSIK